LTKQQENEALLGGSRVLDLCDYKGLLCGKILGGLGADVVKIESPGGDLARDIGPFYHDIPDREKSLFWFALNTNKRGITLNIESVDGQIIFKRLVEMYDIVVESFTPGYMDQIGLGYKALSEINPGIIMTSITPFGQTGPYKDCKASDMIVWAMGGMMYLCGDSECPPVTVTCPQAYLNAASDGAIGSMMALYYREISGEGQQVDVSAQQSVASNLARNAQPTWDLLKRNQMRVGSDYLRASTWTVEPQTWPCKDGYVTFRLGPGGFMARYFLALLNWMEEEGMNVDFLKSIDWNQWDIDKATQDELDKIMEPIGRFILTHNKMELYEGAIEKGVMLYPVNTAKDLLGDKQLAARNFWVRVEHTELDDSLIYPGPFTKLSESSCAIQRRAPLIGEHNEEIYEKELGLSRENLFILKQAGVI